MLRLTAMPSLAHAAASLPMAPDAMTMFCVSDVEGEPPLARKASRGSLSRRRQCYRDRGAASSGQLTLLMA